MTSPCLIYSKSVFLKRDNDEKGNRATELCCYL